MYIYIATMIVCKFYSYDFEGDASISCTVPFVFTGSSAAGNMCCNNC